MIVIHSPPPSSSRLSIFRPPFFPFPHTPPVFDHALRKFSLDETGINRPHNDPQNDRHKARQARQGGEEWTTFACGSLDQKQRGDGKGDKDGGKEETKGKESLFGLWRAAHDDFGGASR